MDLGHMRVVAVNFLYALHRGVRLSGEDVAFVLTSPIPSPASVRFRDIVRRDLIRWGMM